MHEQLYQSPMPKLDQQVLDVLHRLREDQPFDRDEDKRGPQDPEPSPRMENRSPRPKNAHLFVH